MIQFDATTFYIVTAVFIFVSTSVSFIYGNAKGAQSGANWTILELARMNIIKYDPRTGRVLPVTESGPPKL